MKNFYIVPIVLFNDVNITMYSNDISIVTFKNKRICLIKLLLQFEKEKYSINIPPVTSNMSIHII